MKVLASLLVCALSSSTVLAEDSVIYDANPSHPWNLLSAALHSDAPARFESPADFEARLLTGEGYESALKALDDFVAHHREKLIRDPVKRALLQGELWTTFDQVSDGTGESQVRRNAIARRSAVLIKRLALSDADIATLPDTYSLTVNGRLFPAAYDPRRRETPFLPDDLFGEGRPWVMLSASANEVSQPAATQHVKATQGRSVFYPMIRLPGGRQATLAYLKELAVFPEPYVSNDIYKSYPYARSALRFNPALPQFPAGTQVALARRMVVVNSRGELKVTPITESIQLRVYALDPKTAQPGALANQDFYELILAPGELFERKGGLRASARMPAARHPVFEKATVFSQGNNCNNCHGDVGVFSLNTYTHLFGTLPNSPWFEPSDEKSQDRNTLDWKKRDYTWGLLSALLQSNQ
jgi:hypothetical protein